MIERAAFLGMVLALGAAVVSSELRKAEAPAGPQPIVNLIADGQRELTRLPVSFAPLPDAEEIKIGDQLAKSYSRFWAREREDEASRAMEDYIRSVGGQVAALAHRKLPYRFHYIPSLDFVNAFALPGGHVYVGGGLMALMESEDALAAVLGHEIEHIDHYHCAERIQVEAALRRTPLGGLIGIPVEVFIAGYSKDQELEADREGTRLAAAGNYSPQGAIQMFTAFDKTFPREKARPGSPVEELSQGARQVLEGYFRSHPLPEERIDAIRKLINSGQLPSSDRTRPLPVAYYFLRERGFRALHAALASKPGFALTKEGRKLEKDWEAARVKHYQESVRLTTHSLELRADQPRSWEILAVAQFGLADYPAAVAAYWRLQPDYPAFAGGVQEYVDQIAREAMREEQYDRAARLAKEMLNLQPNVPPALKVLAEAQLAAADFIGARETCARLKSMYPPMAEEVRVYAARLASTYWDRHQYQEAAHLSAQALEIKPNDGESLLVHANSQFALADFESAAESYRRLAEMDAGHPDYLQTYADALAAAQPSPETARRFGAWIGTLEAADPAVSVERRVEQAGMLLMAGDQAPARALLAGDTAGAVVTPESVGRLGWWFYRAGQYDMANSLLSQAVTVRPGLRTLQNYFAWVDLQQGRPDQAIRLFSSSMREGPWNSPLMGRAVARWQTHQTVEALRDFDAAAKDAPEWRNPRWVAGLFPAAVVQSVAEMAVRQSR